MEISIGKAKDFAEITEELDKVLTKIIESIIKAELSNTDKIEVSILLTDNDEICEINNEYRGIDSSTDVLSFPMYENREEIEDLKDVEPIILLGDIVISVDKAVEQAKEFEHSFNREMGFLITHGILHLLGYDHETEDDRKVMREKEEYYLESFNLKR
jgi:probable rRNA maturation factor